MSNRTGAFAALFASLAFLGFDLQPASADVKLDPDPKALPKARTMATAKVDQNFDLSSDKVPFPIRFGICVVQLTAIRDEGRALPAPRADLDKAIADYRALAIELKAYSAKISAAEAQKTVDADLAKAAPDTLQFVKEDTSALGVTVRKARNTDRLLACQLTKDWYTAQNGLSTPVAASEQPKIAAINDAARAAEKANAMKPPALPEAMPPVIYPKKIQPEPAAPAASVPAIPPAPASIPPAGTPYSGDDARDVRVDGRALWSAMTECVAQMDLIEKKGGGSTTTQSVGYADHARLIYRLDRGVDAGVAFANEYQRLRPRVAALWDAGYNRLRQPPWAEWGTACGRLETQAVNYISKKQNENYQRELADFNRREAERARANSSGSSGGGYSSPPGADMSGYAAAAKREHETTMRGLEEGTRRIKEETRALDRKYR